jgi:hypothetical protein
MFQSTHYFIYTRSGSVNIENCTFKNSANIGPPIIYRYGTTSKSFSIINTSFQNLTSTFSGAAIIYCYVTVNRSFTVDNCTFTNIQSTYTSTLNNGGFFEFNFNNSSYSFAFTNSSFHNISFSASSGQGSILYFIGTSLSSFLFQNNILNNISSSMNGVFYLSTTLSASLFTINNCNFTLCTSLYGGAIYFVGVLFIYLIIILLFIISTILIFKDAYDSNKL